MCLEYETVRSIRYWDYRSREGGEDVDGHMDTKYKETDRFDNGKRTVSEI